MPRPRTDTRLPRFARMQCGLRQSVCTPYRGSDVLVAFGGAGDLEKTRGGDAALTWKAASFNQKLFTGRRVQMFY